MVGNVPIRFLKPTDGSTNRLAKRFIALADSPVLRVYKQLQKEAATKYYTEKIARREATCFQDMIFWQYRHYTTQYAMQYAKKYVALLAGSHAMF